MSSKTSSNPGLVLWLLGIVTVLVIAFVASSPADPVKEPSPKAPTAQPPNANPPILSLTKASRDVLTKKGEAALLKISATENPETKFQIASEHLSSLVSYPQQIIVWLKRLNEKCLGKKPQQWSRSFLEYQASLPQPPANSFPFSPRVTRTPSLDEALDDEGKAQLAQETKERELRILQVKFLITLYRDLLANDQMLFPTAQLLPSLGPILTGLLEESQDSSVKEKIVRLFEELGDFRVQQLLGIERIESTLMSDFIRHKQEKWLLPIALQSPALAGELAGHLIQNSVSRYDPLNDAHTATRNIGRKVAKENGLVPLAHSLGNFLKQCPDFGIRLEDSHREVIEDAWKNHLAQVLAKQPDPSKPDWDSVHEETFFKPAKQLDPDERAILAFGMRSFIISHIEKFDYDAKDERSQEIAAYRELTREICHLMMTHHKGWNYRSQSLAIMVFCHAAAKEFDQLLPWAKKSGSEVEKHFQEYYSKLKSNWSPRQNPLTNLAIFWDLRGGFDTSELAPHRRAATLILMEDPTLLKEAIRPDFLTYSAKFTVNSSKVLTFEDVVAILDTWKKRHPDHPGWPEEYAIATAALKKR